MKMIKNYQIPSSHHEKPIVFDVQFLSNDKLKPVILFAHGFKGFKDWGTFPLISDYFAKRGYVFIKLNFSHNGTNKEHPGSFNDLEAFGQNNYTHELNDLDDLINYFFEERFSDGINEFDLTNFFVVGHSRGGGVGLIKAFEDPRIKGVATWAAVASLLPAYTKDVNAWKTHGVIHMMNGRTKQNMPIYYQIYEDYMQHTERFSIENAVKQIKKPFIAIHGNLDETVPFQNLQLFKTWNNHVETVEIKNTGHTFGAKHPLESERLPSTCEVLFRATDDFFKRSIC